jgi:hypothetical protein
LSFPTHGWRQTVLESLSGGVGLQACGRRLREQQGRQHAGDMCWPHPLVTLWSLLGMTHAQCDNA